MDGQPVNHMNDDEDVDLPRLVIIGSCSGTLVTGRLERSEYQKGILLVAVVSIALLTVYLATGFFYENNRRAQPFPIVSSDRCEDRLCTSPVVYLVKQVERQ